MWVGVGDRSPSSRVQDADADWGNSTSTVVMITGGYTYAARLDYITMC